MRRYSLSLLAAAAAIGLTASIASAADLPRKAPAAAPIAPPPFSWTGFYVGINGGGSWGTVESDVTSVALDPPIGLIGVQGFPLSSHGVNGWTFGGTVGYNWQANPWLVLGIEGDFNWTNVEGTAPCLSGIGGGLAFVCNTELKWTADLTGRVGFAIDRALLYVKGGVVWAKSDYNFSSACLNLGGCPPFAINASTSDTRFGGLFGVGIEYAFLPNWSAKLEYNFMDFGHEDETFSFVVPVGPPGGTTVTAATSINQQIHVVKAGINYRFDWGRY